MDNHNKSIAPQQQHMCFIMIYLPNPQACCERPKIAAGFEFARVGIAPGRQTR
jgi:hypothetical protein